MHTEIKTYSLSNQENQLIDFKLQTMEQIEERMGENVDSPHRHNYYTIILIKKGSGKHIIDFQEYEMTNNSIYFVAPGQVHQVLPASRSEGFVLTFTADFLLRNNISEQLINDVYLYNNFGESPPLPLHDHELLAYVELIKQIKDFSRANSNYGNEAIGSLLKLFLIKSYSLCNLCGSEELQSSEPRNPLFRNFKNQIDKNFSLKHKVNDYAELLSVSSDYLNKVVKSLSGFSAKDYIQNRLMVEAKRNLLFTDLSNKELAYQLGFEEPAHFSNFFKKHAGTTPVEFREFARKG